MYKIIELLPISYLIFRLLMANMINGKTENCKTGETPTSMRGSIGIASAYDQSPRHVCHNSAKIAPRKPTRINSKALVNFKRLIQ